MILLPSIDDKSSLIDSITFPPAILASIISLSAYFINKKGHFNAAVGIYLFLFVVPPWWAILRSGDNTYLPISIIMLGGVLLAGIFSKGWLNTVLAAGVAVGSIISIPFLFFDVTFSFMLPIITVSVTLCAMTLVFNFNRDKLEKERIREQTRINEELKKQSNELKIINQQLEEMAFIAAHDLKAPVTNLVCLIEMLEDGNLISEKGNQILDKINLTNSRITDIIGSLNKVFLIQNRLKLPREHVEIELVFKESLLKMDPLIKKSNTKITYSFKDAHHVNFPPVLLISIFENLITNSIKYAQTGILPIIEVYSTPDSSGKVKISVIDNGRGIDLDKYGNKIFRLFQRFHLDVNGSGIGLYTTKMIIEKYGGDITIESTPDQGTKIEFVI
ncbi:MAG: ATP-binding protein [Bacteroidota bacterium]